MTRSWRAGLCLVVAALALVGACGDDDSDQSTTATTVGKRTSTTEVTDPTKKPQSRSQPANVSIKVTGAVQVDYQADTDLQILIFTPPREDLSLLSVGLVDVRNTGDGAVFRTAFDLAGAGIGPGRYRIKAAGAAPTGSPATTAAIHDAGDLSNTFLLYFRLKDPAGDARQENLEVGQRFDRTVKACTIEVGEDQKSGELDCPALANIKGEAVHLNMTWKPVDA